MLSVKKCFITGIKYLQISKKESKCVTFMKNGTSEKVLMGVSGLRNIRKNIFYIKYKDLTV